MANANYNKIIIDGETKIDLTGDTVTESDVVEGKTFHDASGAKKTGTKAEPKLQSKSVTITSNGTINISPDSGYDGLSEAIVNVNVSGSTTAEKCTIVLTHNGSDSRPIKYVYRKVSGTSIYNVSGALEHSDSITLSDVACDSLFAAVGGPNNFFEVSTNITDGGYEIFGYPTATLMYAITPKTAGATGTITVSY